MRLRLLCAFMINELSIFSVWRKARSHAPSGWWPGPRRLRTRNARDSTPCASTGASSGGAAGSWAMTHLGPRALAGDFGAGFYVKHIRKDIGIAIASAEELGLGSPASSARANSTTGSPYPKAGRTGRR